MSTKWRPYFLRMPCRAKVVTVSRFSSVSNCKTTEHPESVGVNLNADRKIRELVRALIVRLASESELEYCCGNTL